MHMKTRAILSILKKECKENLNVIIFSAAFYGEIIFGKINLWKEKKL